MSPRHFGNAAPSQKTKLEMAGENRAQVVEAVKSVLYV